MFRYQLARLLLDAQQPRFDVLYKAVKVGEYVPDLIAFNAVVVDAKVIEAITDQERGQMLNYLRITNRSRNLFFKSSWARYGEATKGTWRVVPPAQRLKAVRDDSAKMQQLFFSEPPELDKIIALLKQWESEFNQK